MKTVNFRLWYLERIWFSTLTRSMKCWYNFIFGARSKLSQWQSFGFLNGCSIQQPRKWYEYKWDLDDEITLRAAAEIFNIEFVIISILGRAAKANTTQQKVGLQGYRVAFIWDTLRRILGNITLFLTLLKIPISLMNLLILK